MDSTAQIRFRESATRLPEPITFGSDYSIRPIPGQQALFMIPPTHGADDPAQLAAASECAPLLP